MNNYGTKLINDAVNGKKILRNTVFNQQTAISATIA